MRISSLVNTKDNYSLYHIALYYVSCVDCRAICWPDIKHHKFSEGQVNHGLVHMQLRKYHHNQTLSNILPIHY